MEDDVKDRSLDREEEGRRSLVHDAVDAHSTGHATALSRAVRSGALTTPVIELETVTVRFNGGR